MRALSFYIFTFKYIVRMLDTFYSGWRWINILIICLFCCKPPSTFRLNTFCKYLTLQEVTKEMLECKFQLDSEVVISGLKSQRHIQAVVSPGIFPTLWKSICDVSSHRSFSFYRERYSQAVGRVASPPAVGMTYPVNTDHKARSLFSFYVFRQLYLLEKFKHSVTFNLVG